MNLSQNNFRLRHKLPKAFASLRYPNYRNFWLNEGVSLIGLWMQMIAQGWLVYDITGSKFLLGLINTIAGLPVIFFTPAGGIIADHVNKKNLLIATQIVFAFFPYRAPCLYRRDQLL